MRTSLALLLLAVIVTLSMTGCYYDNEEYLYGPGCDYTDVTYATGVAPILQGNCQSSSCHGAGGGGGELTSYTQIKAVVDNGSFRNAVIVSKSMPLGGALSSCELGIIEKWLDAGAPNN
jgi:hypothetical protein